MKRQTLYRTALAIFALLGLSTTACGATAPVATEGAPPTALADADESASTTIASRMDRVVFATRQSIDSSPFWVADVQGFFDEQNIEPIFLPVADEKELFGTLLGDEAQFGVVSAASAVDRISLKRAPLTLSVYFDGTHRADDDGRGTISLLSAELEDITSGCDLEDTWVGVESLTSLDTTAIREMITREGCDPAKVHFVAGDPGSHLERLQNGALRAAAFQDPFTTEALQSGLVIVENLDAQLCGGAPGCPLTIAVSNSAWVRENPELHERVQRALHNAIDWIGENEAEYRATLVSCCALSVKDAGEVEIPKFVGDHRDLSSDITNLVEIMVDQGTINMASISGGRVDPEPVDVVVPVVPVEEPAEDPAG